MAIVGSVAVSVVPSVKDFARDLRAKLGTVPGVEVTVGADTGPAERDIDGLRQRESRKPPIKPKVIPEVDQTALARLRTQLEQVAARVTNARIDVADKDATAKILAVKARLLDLGKATAKPGIDVVGIARAEAGIAALSVSLDRLGKATAKPAIDVAGIAQTEADVATLSTSLDRLGRKRETPKVAIDTKGGAGGLLATLAAIAPAAVPAAAALTGVGAAAGGAFALAGAGAVAFGVIAKAAYTQTTKDAKALATAQAAAAPKVAALAAAQRAVAKAQAQVNASTPGTPARQKAVAALAVAQQKLTTAQNLNTIAQTKLNLATANYTPAEKLLTGSILKIKAAFHGFVIQEIPAVSGVLAGFFPLAHDGFKALAPVIGGVGGALTGLEKDAHKALNTQFYKQFFGFLSDQAPKAITALGKSAGNLATGFAGGIRAFGPLEVQLERGLVRATGRFADLGKTLTSNPAFLDFLTYVQQEAPVVGQLLSSLGSTFLAIAKDAAPIGAIELDIITKTAQFAAELVRAHPHLVEAGIAVLTIAKAVKVLKLTAAVGAIDKLAGVSAGAIVLLGKGAGALRGLGAAERGLSGSTSAASALGGIAGGFERVAAKGAPAEKAATGLASKLPGLSKLGRLAGGALGAEGLAGALGISTVATGGLVLAGAALGVGIAALIVHLRNSKSGFDTFYQGLTQQYQATGNNVAGYKALIGAQTTAATKARTLSNVYGQELQMSTQGTSQANTALTVTFGKMNAAQQVAAHAAKVAAAQLGVLRGHADLLGARLGASRGQALQFADAVGINLAGATKTVLPQIATAARNVGGLEHQFGITRDQAVALASRLNLNLTQSFQGNSRAATTARSRIAQYKAELQLSHSPALQLASDISIVGDRSKTADQQVAAFSGALNILIGKNVDAAQASITFRQQVNGLAEAVVKGHKTLSGYSSAALTNRSAILGAVTAADEHAQAVYRQTGSVAKATGALRGDEKALETNATKVYGNKAAVDRLLGSVGALPKQAGRALAGMRGFATGTDSALAGIHNRKITVTAAGTYSQGGIRAMAEGGMVRGPGGPRDDRLLRLLSNNEFVQPAHVVRRETPERMELLRQGKATIVPKLADGGLVSLATKTGDPTAIARAWARGIDAFDKVIAAKIGKYLKAHAGGAVLQGSADVQKVALQTIQQLGRPLSEVAGWVRRIMFESGGNPKAVNKVDSNWVAGHPCVPLDSLILTRRGWLRHDQVTIDDETLGYSPETGRSEWTRVTAVHHYDDAEVWEIGNGSWRVRATPNHRWWTDRFVDHVVRDTTCPECGLEWATERGMETHLGRVHGQRLPKVRTVAGSFVETQDLAAGDRLRLAAPADTDGIPGLTVDDARIIAWLQGDGHVSPALAKPVVCPECGWTPGTGRRPYRGPVAQPGNSVAVHRAKAHRVSKHDTEAMFDGSYDGSIYQAKPEQVIRLRALLAYVPHTEHVRQRQAEHLPEHHFKLRRAYVTDLLKRARWDELTPSALVLAMSPDQRAGWLDAMIDAEGNRQAFAGKGWTEFVRISQNDGDVLDAIALAVFLEGYRPALARRRREAPYQPHSVVSMCGPHVAPSMFEAPKSQGAQPVWCVTTELGTWTMRQGRRIMLTGNSVGLSQVIAGTFAANARQYRNVGPFAYGVSEDPMANSYAGGHYAVGRYGSLAAVDPRVRPVGYDGGGRPPVGVAALVGERGPELFVPHVAGQIVPAAQTRQMVGGRAPITVTFTGPVNGPLDVQAELRRALFLADR